MRKRRVSAPQPWEVVLCFFVLFWIHPHLNPVVHDKTLARERAHGPSKEKHNAARETRKVRKEEEHLCTLHKENIVVWA